MLQAVTTARRLQLIVLLLTVTLLVGTSVRPSAALGAVVEQPDIRLIPTPQTVKPLKIATVEPATQLHPEQPPEPNRHLQPGIQPKPVELAAPPTDCTSQPCIALSFDDGPNPATTPEVLTTLELKHVAATFFLVGRNIAGNETLVQRMAADGFEVGNHSWDHPNMIGLTPEQISTELLSTQAAIVNAGAPLPTLFRPPYGAVNDKVLADAGLQAALWNIDPDDWKATDPALLAQQIVATAKPGGIIDLHDIHQVTADALPAVVDQLAAQGYKFVTVSQLLHSRDRPGHDPFYGYAAAALPL
jgi:peptidoglycan/xylan/chitin deacetylase (PgdA/CDA1 family)